VISFGESISLLEVDILGATLEFVETGWLNISLSSKVREPGPAVPSVGLGLSDEGVVANSACKPSHKKEHTLVGVHRKISEYLPPQSTYRVSH
jgi:hypothetical protein